MVSQIPKSSLRNRASSATRAWIIGLLATAFCVSSASGQTSSEPVRVSVNVLTNLARGISLDEFAKQLGVKPTHQFTARLGSNELTCVSFQFERPRGRLYFLFASGKLTAIQDTPKVEFETKGTVNGKPWEAP